MAPMRILLSPSATHPTIAQIGIIPASKVTGTGRPGFPLSALFHVATPVGSNYPTDNWRPGPYRWYLAISR
ncbi:hypothetical protein J1614_000980 [Plenodomus biglobosus]|nr:hypothetical protein J1614_000980 [Plenodomus biglobosus]